MRHLRPTLARILGKDVEPLLEKFEERYGVTAAAYVPQTDHTVASVFWEFMNQDGPIYRDGSYMLWPLFESPFYATGYPIAEAFWATVTVGGTPQDVLIQCFERRCLTYTPGNPAGFTVEAGNVGQHYYRWRYELNEPTPTATAASTPPP